MKHIKTFEQFEQVGKRIENGKSDSAKIRNAKEELEKSSAFEKMPEREKEVLTAAYEEETDDEETDDEETDDEETDDE